MLDWNARSRTFEKIAGFTPNVGGMVMAGRDGNAETVSRQWVTAGIFDVLGVTPIAGRTFTPRTKRSARHVDRDERGVLAHRASIAIPPSSARTSRLDGILWTVVGIVPKDFELLGRTQHLGDAAVRQPAAAGPRRRTCCRWSAG